LAHITVSRHFPQHRDAGLDLGLGVPPTELFFLGVAYRQHYLVFLEVLRASRIGKFQCVDTTIKASQAIGFDNLLFLFDELVKVNASIIATTGHQVTAFDRCGGKQPRLILMTVVECEYWALLVHDPEIEAIIRMRTCHEEMVVDDIQSISVMLRVFVEQLRIFIYLPEDNLAIKATTDDSIF